MTVETKRFLVSLWESTSTCLALVLLLALAQPYFSKFSSRTKSVLTGLLFGFVTLVSMQTPLRIGDGIVIDARVVLVGLSGLAAGWESALVAVCICVPYRMFLGGTGTLAGSGAIIFAGAIGALFQRHLCPKPGSVRIRDLVLFGLVLGLNGIVWTFFLPSDIALKMALKLAVPVTVMYPISSALLGSLFFLVIQRQVALDDLNEARIGLLEMNQSLERTVEKRTSELRELNAGLSNFTAAVAHDLNAPIRRINSFGKIVLQESKAMLDEDSAQMLERIVETSKQMGVLVDDLLSLSKTDSVVIEATDVNLSAISSSITERLKQAEPARDIQVTIKPDMYVQASAGLMQVVLENMLRNAFKFSSHRETASIEFGQSLIDGKVAFFIKDNGAGFDMAYADMLFKPFERLHSASEFPGSGIGLTTVSRIISKHGGDIWAEGQVGEGATFYFTLPGAVISPAAKQESAASAPYN